MSSASAPALALRGIDKRFGAVHANRAVSFSAAAGSIHGLVGENGAGKSTLMNIVYGYYPPDAGEIEVGGKRVTIRRPSDAIAAGIGMVHQHFMLVENFTVLENIVLGSGGRGGMRAELNRARTELARIGRDYGLEAPLDEPIEELPVGVQQRVEILKALYREARILILDEPTAVLTPREADQLFLLLDRLRAEGKTVILVTHKLREVMAITDQVTVLRQGQVVSTLATRETSPSDLAEKMVGRAVALRVEKKPRSPGPVALSVEGLEVRDRWGVVRLRDASFELRQGEIVAIAGVAGNGQSELLSALAGLCQASAGKIVLQGREVGGGETAAVERRRLGLAYVPEDRLKEAIVGRFAAEDNAVLGRHDGRPCTGRFGFLDRAAIRRGCEQKMADWDVRPAEPERRMGAFSGGNQQKLVLAREIEAGPAVLIIGQPTRGVDIGAIEFIHRRLVELRDAGKAVLVVSVEMDEIMGLADRILVMTGGSIVGQLTRAEATEERIGLLMAGVPAGSPSA
ncbi:MAG TPA: ABC transporter ATP-binding protein [Opitutaceae bacterium]